ncbi:hypothetical protein JB92DRAFT_2826970 [Gautieria morchelliformis]|nr:hypothetical protein JB92DRAFT_2826970 [Gautieria morchelliformis]
MSAWVVLFHHGTGGPVHLQPVLQPRRVPLATVTAAADKQMGAQDKAGAISSDGRLVAADSLNTIDSVYSVAFKPKGNDDFPHQQAQAWARARPGLGLRARLGIRWA